MPYIDSASLSEHWEELLAVKPKIKIPIEDVLEEGDELLTIETAPKAVSFSDPYYSKALKGITEAPEYLKVLTIDVSYNEIVFSISNTLGVRLIKNSGYVVLAAANSSAPAFKATLQRPPEKANKDNDFYCTYLALMSMYFKSSFVDLKRNVKTESFRVLIDISKDLETLLTKLKEDFERGLTTTYNNRQVVVEAFNFSHLDPHKRKLSTNRLEYSNLVIEGSTVSLSKYYRNTKSSISLSRILLLNPDESTEIELLAKEDNSINIYFHTLETFIKGKKKVEMGIGSFINKYCYIDRYNGSPEECKELLTKVIEDLSTSVHTYLNRSKITTEITTDVYFGYMHENYTNLETGAEIHNSCMRNKHSAKVCHNYYSKFIEQGLLDFVVQKDCEDRVAGRVLVWKDSARNTVYVDRYYPGISTLKNSINDTIFEVYKGKKIYNTGRDDLRTGFDNPSGKLVVRCDFMLEYFKDTLFNDSSSLHKHGQDSGWYYGITARTTVANFVDTVYGSSIATSKERAQAFGEVMLSGGMEIATQVTNGSRVPYMDSFSKMVVIGEQCWLVHNKLLDSVRNGLEKVPSSLIHSEKENNKISYYDYIRKHGPAKEITAALQAKMKEILEQNKTIIINE